MVVKIIVIGSSKKIGEVTAMLIIRIGITIMEDKTGGIRIMASQIGITEVIAAAEDHRRHLSAEEVEVVVDEATCMGGVVAEVHPVVDSHNHRFPEIIIGEEEVTSATIKGVSVDEMTTIIGGGGDDDAVARTLILCVCVMDDFEFNGD